ncbi:polysaccharide deacetylase family protein [Pelomonas sp. BJYL3]|uniref:polysaccharide deacetylase family protein n=1 Tax=Pelomonas sp. BJYL3 TaxID=2976697 RepID=UPI0022B32F17|nr:polysaccharide deacetylase family protein [Pelomonas sp. BJYL3]
MTEPSLRADTRLATPDPAFLAAVRPLPEELEGLAPRLLAAVIHDVAPSSWSDCRSLIDQLDEMGIRPLSLLAVPRFHGSPRDPAFERWLLQRAEAGDELVLHGYDHRDPLLPRGGWQRVKRLWYTHGEGEFSALPYAEARRRLTAGRRWMESLGVRPAGFVPPAWLMSAGSWEALREQPLLYTCTLRQVVLLPHGPTLSAMAQVWSARSASRRLASAWWNAALLSLQAERPLLRLELHPLDARHASARRSWQRVATAAMSQRRQPVSLLQVAQLLESTA